MVPTPVARWSHIHYLAYQAVVGGHPANQMVELGLFKHDGGETRVLGEFIGGQGSINVPNWSRDGGHFAFVRYFNGN